MQFSTAPRRTMMNDVNRARFSIRDPPTENNPLSQGPQAYKPEHADRVTHRNIHGYIHMRQIRGLDGRTEREKTLANGVPIDNVLPVGPGDYEVDAAYKAMEWHTPTSPHRSRSRPFGVTSPRFAPPRTDEEREGHLRPGPGSYKLPDLALAHSPSPPLQQHSHHHHHHQQQYSPNAVNSFSTPRRDVTSSSAHRQRSTSPRTVGGWSRTPRAVCSPIEKEPPLPDAVSKKTLSGTCYSSISNSSPQMNATIGVGYSNSSRGRSAKNVSGGFFGTAPRHMNLHNINSPFPREHDSDFSTPAPGSYNPQPPQAAFTTVGKGKISLSPRRMDMNVLGGGSSVRRDRVPGPGAYNVGGGTSPEDQFYYPDF